MAAQSRPGRPSLASLSSSPARRSDRAQTTNCSLRETQKHRTVVLAMPTRAPVPPRSGGEVEAMDGRNGRTCAAMDGAALVRAPPLRGGAGADLWTRTNHNRNGCL